MAATDPRKPLPPRYGVLGMRTRRHRAFSNFTRGTARRARREGGRGVRLKSPILAARPAPHSAGPAAGPTTGSRGRDPPRDTATP
jgi:hypothetical protein